LLSKLVYLSYGLSVILGFIGVKLVLEALHENNLPFLNGGEPVPVPTIGIALSLSVIIGVLVITTVASLVKVRRDPSAVHPPAAEPAVDDDSDDGLGSAESADRAPAGSTRHAPGKGQPDPTRA
jgi:tellurite resistance protein TerC